MGWNFVDYRGSGTPEVSYIVDMDTEWPTEVGWRQMVYEDVNIQFSEHGASKGSWSVSGLATWQEAWFRVQAVHSVLEAKDRKLFDEVNPHLSTLWRLAKSGKWLLQVSDIIFGALLAAEKDLNTVQEWAQNFQSSGQEELAASLQKIVASA